MDYFISTFLILTILEILLGIDNIIFISIVVQNLPNKNTIRFLGLSFALTFRLVMLFNLIWLMKRDVELFYGFSIKDLILELGGIFLIFKSTKELYNDCNIKLQQDIKQSQNQLLAILQIILIDLVFSIDSVLVAIGLTNNMIIISSAFAIAMLIMLILSKYSIELLNKFPRLKIVALMFIMMVGILLVAEGIGIHIEKGYLYFAFIFSLIIETLFIIRNKHHAID